MNRGNSTMDMRALQDLIPLYVAGALDGDDLSEFERALHESSEELRQSLQAWEETELALGSLFAPAQPPDSIKDKLMRRIREKHAAERSMEGPGQQRLAHGEGIYTVFPDAMEWCKHPVPGVWFKVLSESRKRGYITMLMKVEPGVRFPEHHHSGDEECYVINGSIIINGRRLGPGVLHHGDENSDHAVLSTDEGALLLLVVAKDDYIPPAV